MPLTFFVRFVVHLLTGSNRSTSAGPNCHSLSCPRRRFRSHPPEVRTPARECLAASATRHPSPSRPEIPLHFRRAPMDRGSSQPPPTLEPCSAHLQTGYPATFTPRRTSPVLEIEIALAAWSSAGNSGDHHADSAFGDRESVVGCRTYSRRIAQARSPRPERDHPEIHRIRSSEPVGFAKLVDLYPQSCAGNLGA